jgi:hypothetical protein
MMSFEAKKRKFTDLQNLFCLCVVGGLTILFAVLFVSFGSLIYLLLKSEEQKSASGRTSYEAAAAISSWESAALCLELTTWPAE